MSDDPIADLLHRIAAQDRTAFRQAYALTASKLTGVLLRMLGERAEAEDALQEVFTRVWLRAGRYDAARGRGMTWLIAIARNIAIDRLRSRRDTTSDGPTLDALIDMTPGAERQMIAAGEARRITDCLGQLEADRADAVRRAYLGGVSYADLALRHNVPLNTMRTWLRRSLLKLKECLEA